MDRDNDWQLKALLAAGLLFLVALVVGAVVANMDDDDAVIDGTTWELERLVVDGEMVPAIDGPTVTISFGGDSMSGFGGCNSYFGDYEVDGNALEFGPIGSTLAICDDAVGTSDQEFAYLANLAAVDTFRVVDGQLILGQGDDDLLEFTAIES